MAHLSIAVPGAKNMKAAATGATGGATTTSGSLYSLPTSLSDFTCFGVKVTGPGINDDPRFSCSPNGGIGIVAGLVPAGGGTVDLLVPAGPARNITVFGLISEEGCPSLDSLLAKPPNNRFSELGYFYQVGTAVTDITDDTTVTIDVSFGQNSSQILVGCSGWGSSGTVTAIVNPITLFPGATTASGGTGALAVTARLSIGNPILIPGAQASGGSGVGQITLSNGVAHE